MLVSYKWLKDYVDINISPEELADRLTMVGLTVEGIQKAGDYIENVYTGKILETAPHPNADRLTICQISLGGGEPIQIVTGATNIKVGDIIPVATNGAKLANDLVIKKSKLRGIESNGMLCSGEELGLDLSTMTEEEANGIMILPEDTSLGQDIKPLVGLDDAVLELELTPNRGDAMSMLGVAREVAAILDVPLKYPKMGLDEAKEPIGDRVRVEIMDSNLCRRYVAKLFTNVKVASSPAWMQERLKSVGVRPINNIVDITNYVMLEMGQPLHAFDYDKIKDGHIVVRRGEKGKKLVSLDNIERELDENKLVICDSEKELGLAGVMGGLDSEVTEDTTSILLESAWFEPVSIRRTSKALALRSESSSRFERGIDLSGCLRAANRAARLLLDLQAGEVCLGEVDYYPSLYEPKSIILRPKRVEYVLGLKIEKEKCQKILTSLEFKVEEIEDGALRVLVPAHRSDVTIEADLIEEVARMVGYAQITTSLPCGATTPGKRKKEQQWEIVLADKLVAMGFREVVTYSFTSINTLDKLNLPKDHESRKMLPLKNPLSEEQSVMRTVMLPSLLQILQQNNSRKIEDLAIFELGKVYLPQEGEILPKESKILTVMAMGNTQKSWNKKSIPQDFYYLKGVLEVLLATLRIPSFHLEAISDNNAYHPGKTAKIMLKGKEIGILGEIHPLVVENYQLSSSVVALELNFEMLMKAVGDTVVYKAIPRFPAVDRDLALVVEKTVLVSQVMDSIRKTGGQLLKKVTLFDVYQGKQVEEGYQSLAFSLSFIAEDRTLTDEEVSKIVAKIQEKLASKFKAVLRS